MANLIVTGATGGLGTVVTDYLLGVGHRVLAVARDEVALRAISSAEGFHAFAADVTTAEGASAMAAEALRVLGEVNGLVHLVGGFGMGDLTADDGPELWERLFRVNAESAYHCFRAVLPHLGSRGSIVAISSQAVRAPGAKVAAYAASKAALEALVKSTAAEYAAKGVRVNAIAPTTIDTPANRAAMGDKHAHQWVRPETLAATADFLLSDRSVGISGTVIEVSGGS